MFSRKLALSASLAVVLAFSAAAFAQYQISYLTSNVTGKTKNVDPLIVNAWGLAYAPGGAFWISDEGTGWSTLYNGMGVPQSLQVVVPPVSGTGPGSPTGIVYNGSQEFLVEGWASIFMFATIDGTISGWAPQSNPNQAIIGATNPGAVYTGLAITSKTSGNMIYATDVANNKVDVYDGTFKLVKSFTDTALPAGYAPFGIQDINGQLYIAFAPSNGSAGGVIDIYTESGTLVKHLAHGAPLNQPWGFAVAPSNFGTLSNALLVSNNTNTGTINGFDLSSGKFLGTIKNSAGKAIAINQLWGIEFGGGSANNGQKNQLFFTAGPFNNVDGAFGVINAK